MIIIGTGIAAFFVIGRPETAFYTVYCLPTLLSVTVERITSKIYQALLCLSSFVDRYMQIG